MAHYRVIDKASWPRPDHFTFYRTFANPSFNLCVPVEAQQLYTCAKDHGVSFFQLALFGLLRAANAVPQLKQRLRNEDIIEYDAISVMTPIMTASEGFRQVWCDNAANFPAFSAAATPRIEAARSTNPSPLIVEEENFFLRQLPAVAALQRHDPCGILRGRGGARPDVGKLKNGIIPVAGRFNHAFCGWPARQPFLCRS